MKQVSTGTHESVPFASEWSFIAFASPSLYAYLGPEIGDVVFLGCKVLMRNKYVSYSISDG